MKRILLTLALLAASSSFAQPSIGAFQSMNSNPPVGFSHCADEGQPCAFAGRAWVTFGSLNHWTPPKVITTGPVDCAVWMFGDPDAGTTPAQMRTCQYRPLSAAWPHMLPLPNGLVLLNEPLPAPAVEPALCLPVAMGGTGEQGLAGVLPGGYAEARWCRSKDGWVGFFHVRDPFYLGSHVDVKWPDAAPAPDFTGSAVLTWAAPATNADGSPLVDLAGFWIKYGTATNRSARRAVITDPKATSATIGSLTPGTWYFTVLAVNSKGVASAPGFEITKTIAGTPPPPPPPPPPPVTAEYLVSAADGGRGYSVTFSRTAAGLIVWTRSKVTNGSKATIGAPVDCSIAVIEGLNRYCKFSPFSNDVTLTVPRIGLPGVLSR